MAIHELVQQNDVETLKKLLNGDLSMVNEKIGDLQNTPLHTAARKGLVDISKLLLNSGAKLNTVNKKSLTPIQIAANYGRLEVLKLMLNDEPKYLNYIDHTGNSLLMLAAIKGHVDTVTYLLSHHADVSVKNKDGNNVFHVAAEKNRLKVLDLLIKKKEYEFIDESNRVGCTPLHLAAGKGYDKVVKMLLLEGANPQVRNSRGKTAFMMAHEKCKNIFKFHQNYKEIKYWCHSDMSSLLSKKVFEEGNSAFHIAALFPKSRQIIKAIADGGVNIRTYNHNHMMPIHVAADCGEAENVSEILKHGGRVNDIIQDNGNTALHIACHSNNKDIAEVLLRHHADVTIKNKLGLTPLTFAIKHHAVTVIDYLSENRENCDLKDSYNNSLLHHCVIENSPLISEKLLNKNSELLKTINNDGDTPLMLATKRRNSGLIELFMKFGANANFKNVSGLSAISIAIESGSEKICGLLKTPEPVKRSVRFK